MKNNRIVIAGGSGFLGQALAGTLAARGYEPVILTRDPASYNGDGRANAGRANAGRAYATRAVAWDGRTVEDHWVAELEGARALVNLTGKNVNCRQTRRNRAEILRSRVDSVRVLGEALRLVYRPPEVWVQATSLAIYGDAGDRVCDESGFIPDEYPTDVCRAWEEALGEAVRPEMRWVAMRIGFVLGRKGGALPTLARLAKYGLGGRIGSGRQWISWIHLDDMMRLFLEAIENDHVCGICNATGLQPVTNAEFMTALRNATGAPFGIPTPAWLMRVVAPVVGADPGLALNGRRGLPCRIHGLGFTFRHHDLDAALEDLLKRRTATAAHAGKAGGVLAGDRIVAPPMTQRG